LVVEPDQTLLRAVSADLQFMAGVAGVTKHLLGVLLFLVVVVALLSLLQDLQFMVVAEQTAL
jgi:hypothetical protein